MPSIKDVLKPIEVNLVEEKEWGPWDLSGQIMDLASDNAYEEFRASHVADCQTWLEDVIEVGEVSVKDWTPKKEVPITQEDGLLVCNALMEGGTVPDDLEPFFQLVNDAMTWMYEAAYLPHDVDVEYALEVAQERAVESVSLDEGVWEPLGWSDENILEEIVQAVRYVRQENHYDRFLKFYPSQIDAVMKLVGALDSLKLDPDITEDEYLDSLRYDLKNVFDDVLLFFWDALRKEMERVDVFNRTDWRANWTNGILQDKEQVKTATRGIRRFITEARKEEADA